MIIPWQELDGDTLTNLIEQFVLQEGTEYGEQDVSLEVKVDAVRSQLQQGKVVARIGQYRSERSFYRAILTNLRP